MLLIPMMPACLTLRGEPFARGTRRARRDRVGAGARTDEAAIVIIVNIVGLARVECLCRGCRDGFRGVSLCATSDAVGQKLSEVT